MARIALRHVSIIMSKTSEHLATESPDPPSIVEAVLDVVEAGQQVVVDRIELIRFDALRSLSHIQHQLLPWAAAVVLFSTAWIAANCTATLFLAERLSWVIAGSITAGVNAAIGFALIVGSSKSNVARRYGVSEDAP